MTNEKTTKTSSEILESLFTDQRATANNPQHSINERLRTSLKAEQEKLDKIKKPQSID